MRRRMADRPEASGHNPAVTFATTLAVAFLFGEGGADEATRSGSTIRSPVGFGWDVMRISAMTVLSRTRRRMAGRRGAIRTQDRRLHQNRNATLAVAFFGFGGGVAEHPLVRKRACEFQCRLMRLGALAR